mgnify:CR=1 FL=1
MTHASVSWAITNYSQSYMDVLFSSYDPSYYDKPCGINKHESNSITGKKTMKE